MNRRMLLGAIAAAPILLSGCASSVTLAAVQGYAATVVAALTAVAPLVEVIEPSISAELNKLVVDAQAAEKAIQALTSPTGATSTVQAFLTLINQGFSIVEAIPGIPAPYLAGIAAAQILMVAIASFFGISLATASAVFARARTSTLEGAVQQYMAVPPSGRKRFADSAQSQVKAWVSSLPRK